MPTQIAEHLKKTMALLLAATISLGPAVTPAFAAGPNHAKTGDSITASPIKHVIVVVGENRSFDHLFATYPPKAGETVNNLLSEGIVNADGTPGSNFAQATQFSADIIGATTYEPSPTSGKAPYATLPAPLTGGPSNVCADNGLCNLGQARSSEDGLPSAPLTYYDSLLAGGSGLIGKVPDSRITGVNSTPPYSTLAPGPFQITNSSTFPYNSYANSPVHRFYQM